MSPEYGATCGIFPVDKETLTYLRLTGRAEEQIALVEAYCREQGLFHDEKTAEAQYSELLALDLGTVESSLAGPKRPQDRVPLPRRANRLSKALALVDQAEARQAQKPTWRTIARQMGIFTTAASSLPPSRVAPTLPTLP